jgi:hypothetical protein
MARIFSLGRGSINRRTIAFRNEPNPRFWVAVKTNSLTETSQGFAVTQDCDSVDELKREVEALKRYLDDVLDEARSAESKN